MQKASPVPSRITSADDPTRNAESLNRETQRLFRKDLTRFVLLPAILLLILSIVSVSIARYYVTNEIKRNNQATLNLSAEYMDIILSELEALGLNYSGATDLRVVLKQLMRHDTMTYDSWHSLSLVQSIMFTQSTKPYIDSIYLYYNNTFGRFLSTAQSNFAYIHSYYDKQWYDLFLENKNRRDIWSSRRIIEALPGRPMDVLSVFIPLYSSLEASNYGVAVLNMPIEYIENSLGSTLSSKEQCVVIYNESNVPVLSSNGKMYPSDELGKIPHIDNFDKYHTINNKDCMITSSISSKLNWRYVLITPKSFINAIPNLVLVLNLALMLALVLISFPLVLEVTRKSRNTLKSIASMLYDAENGIAPTDQCINPDSYDNIIFNLLDTFIEHKNLQSQLEERKYQMQILELKALQSQINPHFLFNTLHTMNWKAIALTQSPNAVSDMIENLSTILNYSLRDPLEIVTLTEEIACTQSYLELIKVRYQSSVQIRLETDNEVPVCNVPKLILQPLIENSIIHGMKSSEDTLHIEISIHKDGNQITFIVVNDGCTIPAEKLESLNTQIAMHEYPDSAHMGLLNVAKRLNLIFPDSSLTICSDELQGTRVTICIPAIVIKVKSEKQLNTGSK